MTSQEISRIHSKKLATKGKRYYSDDGKTYVGSADGRLIVLQKAVVTDIKAIPEILSKNVQGSLEELAADVHVLEGSNFATITYVDVEVESAKCLSIALSVVL